MDCCLDHKCYQKALNSQAVALKVDKLAETTGLTRKFIVLSQAWIGYVSSRTGAYAEVIAYGLGHSSTEVTLGTYARLDALQES